jgi:hypothetical protein
LIGTNLVCKHTITMKHASSICDLPMNGIVIRGMLQMISRIDQIDRHTVAIMMTYAIVAGRIVVVGESVTVLNIDAKHTLCTTITFSSRALG